MSIPVQQQIIAGIMDDWKRVSGDEYLSGVWIREYPSLPKKANLISPKSLPVAVWYADEEGLQQKTLKEWLSFDAQWAADWKSAVSYPPRFKVGLAALAPFQGSQDWYSETRWGPRWGIAWRWTIQEEKLMDRCNIWIS